MASALSLRANHGQRNARQHKAGGAGGQNLRHMAQRPHTHGQQIAHARPDPVDQPAKEQKAKAIKHLKIAGYIAIASVGPMVERGQLRFEHAQHQPVDVGQHHGGKQQRANGPAQAPGRLGIRHGVGPPVAHYQLYIVPSSSRFTGRKARL